MALARVRRSQKSNSRWRSTNARVRGSRRVLEHLVGRALLVDHAVGDEEHAVGDVVREADLVRHQQHRAAFLGERADHAQHLADQLGVERRGRLVEQQHLGVHRQRAGDGDALLLPAREPRRVGLGLVGEADAGELGLGARARLGLALAAHRAQPLHHVAERGHVREQVELLEHHADALAHARQLGFVVAAPAGIGLARRGAADRLAGRARRRRRSAAP